MNVNKKYYYTAPRVSLFNTLSDDCFEGLGLGTPYCCAGEMPETTGGGRCGTGGHPE